MKRRDRKELLDEVNDIEEELNWWLDYRTLVWNAMEGIQGTAEMHSSRVRSEISEVGMIVKDPVKTMDVLARCNATIARLRRVLKGRSVYVMRSRY